MSFRNAFGIYHVLERLLKASPKPLTSVELFDSPDVREYAEDVNQVSDYLGHMYRRELLSRVPSRGVGMARYAYSWKNPKIGSKTPVQRHAQPKLIVRNTENEARITEIGTLQKGAQNNPPAVKVSQDGNTVHIHITIALK